LDCGIINEVTVTRHYANRMRTHCAVSGLPNLLDAYSRSRGCGRFIAMGLQL